MPYTEIIVETTTEGADFVADAFFRIGAGGVAISDPADWQDIMRGEVYWDYVDEKAVPGAEEPVRVSGFVGASETEAKIEAILDIVGEITGIDFGTLSIATRPYENKDWLTEWKKYFTAMPIGRFLILPEWEERDPSMPGIEVKINPSVAFGTGDHESTKLCLSLLSQLATEGKDVIDVGCGSGILGIAAKKAGAKSAYLCDIDSLAVTATKENMLLNGVCEGITVEESDLLAKTDLSADIMLANLTADILIRLAGELGTHLRTGGFLIASGIIHARKEEVRAAFLAAGFCVAKEEIMGEWDAFLFQKQSWS